MELKSMLGTQAACLAVGRARATHYRHVKPPGPKPTGGPARAMAHLEDIAPRSPGRFGAGALGTWAYGHRGEDAGSAVEGWAVAPARMPLAQMAPQPGAHRDGGRDAPGMLEA